MNEHVTLTDDNQHDLCTCGHERGWHWDGTGACGDHGCCVEFGYDHLRNAPSRVPTGTGWPT